MTYTPSSNRVSRLGLTLMELVVVLVILIAVAGVLLPMLPSLLTKAHDAVTTTNIAEVDKAMTGFLSTNLSYPNQFDSLVDASGNMYAGLLFNPANVNQSMVAGSLFVAPLTVIAGTGYASSLNLGGINNLMIMSTSTASPPAFNATFPNVSPAGVVGPGPYIGLPTTAGSMIAVQTGTNVLQATPAYVYARLNVPPKIDSNGNPCIYVVFGLGPYTTIVGSRSFGLFDAPVAFGEHSFEQPVAAYARYLCIFRAYDDGTRCEFIGAAHDDATGFGTYDMHMQEYYQTTN